MSCLVSVQAHWYENKGNEMALLEWVTVLQWDVLRGKWIRTNSKT